MTSILSYHSRLFVKVDPHRPDAVGDQRYEEDEDLDERHPVGEVGPVIPRIPTEFSFPVRLWGSAGGSASGRGESSDNSHPVFPPIRVIECGVQ